MEETKERLEEAGNEELAEFWNDVDEKPFIDIEFAQKFNVKFVQLEKYHGVHRTGKAQGLRFDAKILKGELSGKVKELTIYGSKARVLAEEFGTREPEKWVGEIVSLNITKKGSQFQMDLHKYEELQKPPPSGGAPIEA